MTTDFYNLHTFFTNTLDFLKDNQWIYNYPNTHILHNKVLDEIPLDWIHHLNNCTNDELNGIPFGNVNEDWPESLKSLVCRIPKLVASLDVYNNLSSSLEVTKRLGHTPKKKHEIECLAGVINNVCLELNLNCVIDVGAGLGYLSQLLYASYKYKVLAIEGNENIYTAALQHQEKTHPNTKSYVKYVQHFVTLESSQFITAALKEHFKDFYEAGVCITGLHACADLSVTILKIFMQLDFVKCIIIMPCCYHRLDVIHNEKYKCYKQFKNFPVSTTLKTAYINLKGWEFLQHYFLRLACQQTKHTWLTMTDEQHKEHATFCMFRAIIQEVVEEGNLIVKRLQRKTKKSMSTFKQEDTIQNLIANFPQTHKLSRKDDSDIDAIDYAGFQSMLLKKWQEHKHKCKLLEVLTAFQTAIQSLCENVVLLDRVCFLQEKGLHCNIYKVTDDNISPRCHALIAMK